MFIYDEAEIQHIALHKVGNKMQEGELHLAENKLVLNDDLKSILQHWFLGAFKSEAHYNFQKSEDLPNYLQQIIVELFDNNELTFEKSKDIAEYLFQQTNHSKIKSGDLFVVYFTNCVVDDELCDAVGIFKAENKDTFLKIYPDNKVFTVDAEEGININKLDKGVLIFNTEAEFGYKISLVDNINKTVEAQYWRQEFLNVAQRNDEFYQTQSYLDMCKGFVNQVYNSENNIERTEQIDMLNKTANYFEETDNFDIDGFQNDVIGEPEVITAFKDYKQLYSEENDIPLEKEFKISQQAAKKYKNKFKSVLKLDKNFHIYIHGDRKRIEKGFDEAKSLNYYKVFYEDEQ
ncbi:MAG: nucleoid-associated protein [Bacteroidales bacterium]|nr:nucleoid-associated protein [Bacteroidales bacterium]